MEATRRQSGYLESVIDNSDKFSNERFTNRRVLLLVRVTIYLNHLLCAAEPRRFTSVRKLRHSPVLAEMGMADSSDIQDWDCRVSMLKRHAQSAISLKPVTQTPSTLLADLVGMAVAAIAMGLAVFSVWAAQVSVQIRSTVAAEASCCLWLLPLLPACLAQAAMQHTLHERPLQLAVDDGDSKF